MYEIYTKDRIHHGGIARSHDANKVRGTVYIEQSSSLSHYKCTQCSIGWHCLYACNTENTWNYLP